MGATWDLFVDESGDFADAADAVVVAGVLVRRGCKAFAPMRLEHALRAAAPHVPWPLHTSLIWRPSAHVLWRAHEGAAQPADARALDLLRRACPDLLAAVQAQLARGAEPRHADLVLLERTLRGLDGETWPRLTRAAHHTATRIRQVLVTAARQAGDDVALVTAAESTLGDAVPAGGTSGDRYLTLLTRLLERLADALARKAGDHEVRLHVLGRDVQDPLLHRPTPLHVRHLTAAAQDATRAEDRRVTTSSGSVRLVPQPVLAFDAHAPAGAVAADLVANAIRRDVNASAGLRDLSAALSGKLSMGPTLAGRPLVTASGAAAAWLDHARGGRVGPLADGLRRWALEQALAWGRELAPEEVPA